MAQPHLDLQLVDYLKGATHLTIRCVSPQRCGRSVTMLTSELVAKLPRARTVREFQERMKCQRCGCRGWSLIEAAGRG